MWPTLIHLSGPHPLLYVAGNLAHGIVWVGSPSHAAPCLLIGNDRQRHWQLTPATYGFFRRAYIAHEEKMMREDKQSLLVVPEERFKSIERFVHANYRDDAAWDLENCLRSAPASLPLPDEMAGSDNTWGVEEERRMAAAILKRAAAASAVRSAPQRPTVPQGEEGEEGSAVKEEENVIRISPAVPKSQAKKSTGKKADKRLGQYEGGGLWS